MNKSLKVSLLILIISVSFLIGFFGKDFFIKENTDNASITSNVVLQIDEKSLIEKDISELILDSRDIEAGYDLDRQVSGYRKIDRYEYFKKEFEKSQFNYNKSRILILEVYKFKTEDEAKSYLKNMKEEVLSQGYVESTVGEEGKDFFFYKKTYFYDFIKLQDYLGISEVKNAIFTVSIRSYYGQSFPPELLTYLKRSVTNLDSNEKKYPEISKVKIIGNGENLNKINISIQNATIKYTGMFEQEEGYFYKENAEIIICVNNKFIEEGISVKSDSFIIKDNKGNIYSSYSEIEFPLRKISEYPSCQPYSFEIFVPKKHNISNFELYFYDKKVLLDKEGIDIKLLDK